MAKPVTKNVTESTKALLAPLPREHFWEVFDIFQWQGFWFRPQHIEATLAIHSQFEARNDDVILASSMKTGTTWVKALLTYILAEKQPVVNGEKAADREKEADKDPLVENPPAFYIQTLEVQVYTSNPVPDLSSMKSPRVFHTHLPFNLLPESIKNSDCKIVYITRNPKDTLVSLWNFFNNFRAAEKGPYPFEKAFDKFTSGACLFGPFFEHVVDYWKESLKMPNKILFLKYEDLKRDPKGEVKKLAEFLGRKFECEEDVDDILGKCSLERLKSLETNRNGVDPWNGMPKSAYFRRGVVGDWKNYFTAEMADRLDEIARLKLEGSGLNLDI